MEMPLCVALFTHWLVEIALVLGIIIGIVGVLVLNAKTTANFGIISIAQSIVSIWFVFLWQ